jgi:ATPase subunit of ABC transporter with duplicated ATPase domains
MNETWNRDAVSVTNLDLAVDSKILINNVRFTISQKDRIALLGRNGCGKSTLFHWIAERSNLSTTPWSIYEVSQELPNSNKSIVTVVLEAHLERGKLWERQKELETKDDITEEESREYNEIGQTLNMMKADADPPRAKKILHGLGFKLSEMDNPLSSFSGGWRARVALAQGLFMEPDLLLLDEPTNHLDLEGVIWLSAFLEEWSKAFIVISHNVGFIRTIAKTQWLIENQQLKIYKCSYDKYLKQKEQDLKKALNAWEALEKEITTLKGKGTSAAKKQAEELLVKRAKQGIFRPPKPYNPKFFFAENVNESGGGLIKTDGADLGYKIDDSTKVVLKNVQFSLFKGCRVALVGSNGSGKSTLLKFLVGELPPLNGEVEIRHELKICKFEQNFYNTLPYESTPLQYILSSSETKIDIVRKILGASGLEGEAHSRKIGTLSGGQKARVYFASIVAQAPDILLMDEPTNHLDIETIEGLRKGLVNFPGAVIIVSHDIDFLEGIVTEVWETVDGKLKHLSEGIDGLNLYVNRVIQNIEI